MGPLTSILIVVALIITIVLLRRNAGSGKQPTSKRPSPSRPVSTTESNKFHAVSIKFLRSSCDAAKAMDGKRFLSSAAPRLPLPECDVVDCKCKFIHFKDRRDSEDRRNTFGPSRSGGTGEHPEEHREGRDRRAEPPDEL